jgi:hypothetical protein
MEARLGAWGTGLFSDDMACDVRDHYRELIEDGAEDGTATNQTLEKFRAYLEESDGIAVLALAVTQSKLGRLDPGIRDRALAVIDRGADLDAWERDNPKLLPKRRAVLEKARAQLTGPQPARKRLRPPKRVTSGLTAGDVLALDLPERLILLRVVRVRPHRLGETPVLEELDFSGTAVPSRDALEQLVAKTTEPAALVDPSAPDMRFFAFVMQGVDWHGAGFRKAQSMSERENDAQAPLPSAGISWAALAENYRRRSARS